LHIALSEWVAVKFGVIVDECKILYCPCFRVYWGSMV
jgi:hypothetical protein